MKILVFTEGTVIMSKSGDELTREEIVDISRKEGIRRKEAALQYESNDISIEPNSINDYLNYIPVGNAVQKLASWKNQGAAICYLSSRRIKPEIEVIKGVLKKYNFPDPDNLYFRQQGEDYRDVAERIIPDVLIEDDCESIGGEKEMTITFVKPEIKQNIKSIVVKEFNGIDDLPVNVNDLLKVNL